MKRLVSAIGLTILVGCTLHIRINPPTVIAPPEPMVAVFEEVCRRVWREELAREIDPDGLVACVAQQVSGSVDEATIRAQVQTSDEWKQKHAPCPDGWTKQPDLTCTPPPPPPIQRLRPMARALVTDPDGRPFVWRGITAFRLLEQVAHGREADAIAFMDWAKATGFNLVRVLAMAHHLFQLTPDEGVQHLPQLLALAEARGVYVEIVALADTRPYGMPVSQMRAHVRAIGQLAGEHVNAVLEIGNEPYHASQVGELNDLQVLRDLRALVPASVPVSLGAGTSDEIDNYPGGDYITVHTDRSRDTWNRTRHVRELELVSSGTNRFVVDDEPIGAGEADEPGRRSTFAPEFFARGALSRIFRFGATFHCQDCLFARVPGPAQRAAAEAFIAGTRILPDDIRPEFQNSGWVTSPVRGFRFGDGQPNAALRVYTGVDGARGWTVVLGVTGDPGIEFQHGWQLRRVVDERPGVRVLEIGR